LERKLRCIDVRGFLLDLSNRLLAAKDELNAMDAECGDGDFGSTMFIAFSNVRKVIQETVSNDIGLVTTEAGNSILSSSGGASGPMFGTLFIEAGKIAKGKCEDELSQLAIMLDRSMQKIQARGGANIGDKTLVDALEPAVNSLKESVIANAPLLLALRKAAEAAKAGCESTKHMTAKHGKAKYLGDQTLGYVDPGAYTITLFFDSLEAAVHGS
jgi:dihydroxyacetone kinase-like protein